MRNIIIRFIERTIDLAFEEIEVAKLVNITLCDITSIQEIAIKVLHLLHYNFIIGNNGEIRSI
jgi:hypothetical protein